MTVNLNYIDSYSFRLIQFVISSILILVLYFCGELEYKLEVCGKVASILLLLSVFSIFLRALLSKNTLLMLVVMFMMLYALPSKVLFFDQIPFSAHNRVLSYKTALNTTLLLSIFFITINIGLSKINKPIQKLAFVNNDLLFFLFIIIGVVIPMFALKGQSLLSGIAYGIGEKEASSLNEYVLIIYLLAYKYSGNKKCNLAMLYIVLIFYSFKNLLYGGRIEVVMLFFMMFALKFQYSFSFKKVMSLFIIGAWLMSCFANIRSNPTIILDGDIIAVINPFHSSVADIREYQGGNEGDVLWASERMLVLIQSNELTYLDRLESFGKFILSPFISTNLLGETANLSKFKSNIVSTGGGGLAPIFFYAFGGLFGVICLAYFIAYLFNKLSYQVSEFMYIYLILFITTLPRWFAYYPLHLIKYCIWGTICFVLFKSISFTIRKYIKSNLQ